MCSGYIAPLAADWPRRSTASRYSADAQHFNHRRRVAGTSVSSSASSKMLLLTAVKDETVQIERDPRLSSLAAISATYYCEAIASSPQDNRHSRRLPRNRPMSGFCIFLFIPSPPFCRSRSRRDGMKCCYIPVRRFRDGLPQANKTTSTELTADGRVTGSGREPSRRGSPAMSLGPLSCST